MKIAIVDDQSLIRDGLRALLEREGLEVVGEAGDGREALAMVARARPELVVMDLGMPELNGVDATRALLAADRNVKVLGLSGNLDQRAVISLFEAGAAGCLLKSGSAQELLEAIRVIRAGQRYISPAVAGVVLDELGRAVALRHGGDPCAEVTAREREVIQLIAEGRTSKEIAQRLALSVATVESHRRNIMAKLGLKSVAELTKFALREGLTSLSH